ncbi:PAS domain S-box protein [Undibacterium sp. RuTC16W]|uniref:PAS domain S-box protein n=1 Tax=Undibacterium sp. RuTC16W TaxID=3413048 RepID=UPI003BF3E20B
MTPEDMDQLFGLLLETAPIGVAVINRDMTLRYINKRHADLNHLQISAQIGHHIRDFLPAAAVTVVEPKLQFVLDTGSPLVNQEIRAIDPLQSDRPLHRLASYYPWRNKHGNILGVLAIIRDATIDQFSEQLVRESEQRLLRVLDNLYAFVGVLAIDGTLLDANAAPLLAAGIHIDDVRGKKVWDCYWWTHDSEAQEQLKQAIERCRQGETLRYDVQVRMINDSRMWIDFMLAPLYDGEGRITHLIPSGMDISQRHESERRLQLSEERFRSVVESSDDAIISKSLDGLITSWNPAAERLLGYQAAEIIGQSVTLLFPQDKLSEEAEIMRRIRLGERVPSFETVRIHKDGHKVDIAVTISPLRGNNGAIVGASKIARDISEQKRYRELLEQALDEKTSLLHEVHHRVKNNLQIVSSLLHLQARKETPEVRQALAESQGRIKAMALVHQLLYESNTTADINLDDYLRRLVSLTSATYSMSNRDIQILFIPSHEKIKIDIQRAIPCGLIINELILNATKHAFHGKTSGKITIELHADANNRARIVLSDNGCGLPEDFSWSGEGSLGKQLIPMFVQQLKGELQTESTSGGAHFVIEFIS